MYSRNYSQRQNGGGVVPPPDYSGTLYGKLSSKPDEYENNEDSFIKEPPNETEEESYKELNKKIYRPVRKVRNARQKAEKDLFEKDVPISTVSAVEPVDYEENKNENRCPENNFDEGKGLSLGAEDIFLAALLILMINEGANNDLIFIIAFLLISTLRI